MRKDHSLLVAIPAYNEEKTIGQVISKIPKRLPLIKKIEVLVIDDGSVDKTSQVARRKGVKIVRHLINRGLGASLKTAFVVAGELGVDILVTLDADGQHNPGDIKKLIKPILEGNHDVVVGSRLLADNKLMPYPRRLINRLANLLTFIISGLWSSDSQSGFRAFSRGAISKIDLITQRMEVSSEIFREIKKYNLSYTEVPIRPIYTEYSINKGQKMLNAPNVFLKLLIRLLRR